MIRGIIATLIVLIVAPLLVSAGLVCMDPARWGGSISCGTIVMMAVFGILTKALWPRFITTLVAVPLIVAIASKTQAFKDMRLWWLVVGACVIGAMGGIFMMMPLIEMSADDPVVAKQWVIAGAMSGALSFILVVLVYRIGVRASL